MEIEWIWTNKNGDPVEEEGEYHFTGSDEEEESLDQIEEIA